MTEPTFEFPTAVAFAELLCGFRQSTGDTAAENARHILDTIDAHPALAETIPEADLQRAIAVAHEGR